MFQEIFLEFRKIQNTKFWQNNFEFCEIYANFGVYYLLLIITIFEFSTNCRLLFNREFLNGFLEGSATPSHPSPPLSPPPWTPVVTTKMISKSLTKKLAQTHSTLTRLTRTRFSSSLHTRSTLKTTPV